MIYLGLIFGYLSLICLILLLIKFVLHQLNFKKCDQLLMKIHKYLSGALLLIGLCHIISIIPTLATHHMIVIVPGIMTYLIFIWLVGIAHVIKNPQINLFWHRVLSLILLLCITIHIITYFIKY